MRLKSGFLMSSYSCSGHLTFCYIRAFEIEYIRGAIWSFCFVPMSNTYVLLLIMHSCLKWCSYETILALVDLATYTYTIVTFQKCLNFLSSFTFLYKWRFAPIKQLRLKLSTKCAFWLLIGIALQLSISVIIYIFTTMSFLNHE